MMQIYKNFSHAKFCWAEKNGTRKSIIWQKEGKKTELTNLQEIKSHIFSDSSVINE